jgi:hypothetical protein
MFLCYCVRFSFKYFNNNKIEQLIEREEAKTQTHLTEYVSEGQNKRTNLMSPTKKVRKYTQ